MAIDNDNWNVPHNRCFVSIQQTLIYVTPDMPPKFLAHLGWVIIAIFCFGKVRAICIKISQVPCHHFAPCR